MGYTWEFTMFSSFFLVLLWQQHVILCGPSPFLPHNVASRGQFEHTDSTLYGERVKGGIVQKGQVTRGKDSPRGWAKDPLPCTVPELTCLLEMLVCLECEVIRGPNDLFQSCLLVFVNSFIVDSSQSWKLPPDENDDSDVHLSRKYRNTFTRYVRSVDDLVL